MNSESGEFETIIVDSPCEHVQRITLNRPEKRNAISTPMRAEIFAALAAHDHDPDVHVTIIRGAGAGFSSGYDLTSGGLLKDPPYNTAPGPGVWARHVTDGWLAMWDLAKPVIAQVHGVTLAGGTELVQACDLVYVADDARIGYPVVRVASPPDFPYHTALLGVRRAMELMLTGDDLTGVEAAAIGFANKSFPIQDLEAMVLAIAQRIAQVGSDLTQINKRLVHRQAEIMGVRSAIRVGSELQALAGYSESQRLFREDPIAAVNAPPGLKRRNATSSATTPSIPAAPAATSRHASNGQPSAVFAASPAYAPNVASPPTAKFGNRITA